MKNKGIFSIEALAMLFIALIIYLALYPTMDTYIQTSLPDLDTLSAGLLKILPAFWLFFLMLSILVFMPSAQKGG